MSYTDDYARMVAHQQQIKINQAMNAYAIWLAQNPHVEDSKPVMDAFLAGYLEGFSDAY